MQWPGAAIGKEREIARVVAAHDRDFLDAGGHLCHDDRDDALGHALLVEADLRGEPLDCRRGWRRVEADLTAERTVRAEPAQYEIGVGDGRLRSAAAIAGWARNRTGGARAHRDRPAGIERGDRAGAGADAVDLDLLQFQRVGADPPLAEDREATLLDQAGVGRGAAHVVGDQIVVAGGLPDPHRTDDPGGRARQHRIDRRVRDPRDRPGPTVRNHYADVMAIA